MILSLWARLGQVCMVAIGAGDFVCQAEQHYTCMTLAATSMSFIHSKLRAENKDHSDLRGLLCPCPQEPR